MLSTLCSQFFETCTSRLKKTNLLLLQTSRCTWRRKPLLKIRSPSFVQSKSDWNHPQQVWRMWISVNNKATLSQVPFCCSRRIRQDNWSAFSRFYLFFLNSIFWPTLFLSNQISKIWLVFFCLGICRVFFHFYLANRGHFYHNQCILKFSAYLLFFWHVFTIGIFLSATDAIISVIFCDWLKWMDNSQDSQAPFAPQLKYV